MRVRLAAVTARFPKYNQDVLLLVIDLIGTFVFAVEGALAGINAGLDVFGLMVLAFITALGGGTVRDVLLAQVPGVLHSDVYAAAALAGAVVMMVGLSTKCREVGP
jgi:uncharacterized membrane protein YeiH